MGIMFLGNEELGKKDDDHMPTKLPLVRPRWNAAPRPPRGKLVKRLAIAFALGLFLYIFISNLPTDVPIRDRRHPVYRPAFDSGSPGAPKPKAKPKSGWRPHRPSFLTPGTPSEDSASSSSAYNGPLLFEKLLPSLQAIHATGGASPVNKNILFAAASLKSAALLLPMACQMGDEQRNYVHFALVGGSDINMKRLRALNGIDESCQVIFHDARPDFATTSSPERLKRSVARALFHINKYMHPQAAIVDASDLEEDYFLSGIRRQAADSRIPLIELPENAHSRLSWITQLDSSSLAAWDKVRIDILVQAPPSGSGSLIHLLKSLSAADFSAGSTPHLTIELPHGVDRATTEFLNTFQWPPGRSKIPSHPRQLTLRHRIPRDSLTEEESAARFLESFWPSNSKYSHVLVLSPQAQLSPQFFHYLKYSVLYYLYSGTAAAQKWDSRLLGISLDLPSTQLDGSKPFNPPSGKGATSFLWQAPNSNAVLFTGQKWTELHALVSRLLEHQRRTQPLPVFFTEKLVSKKYPSWLEHALKLSRARGYWTIYPSDVTARNLATIHSELYRAPEEYEKELAGKELSKSSEFPVSGGTLFETLPGGKLSSFDEMPILLWDGQITALSGLDDAAAAYANEFRLAVGGCEALSPADLTRKSSMSDLFCMRDG
ncbi:uncharacterized protein P884DRAFT_205502 [Thermothelomyces heterothallicus CBS 202.75]|uniref:uncharacterized protein n=1 Tax=Thermothelomyces heterothallicus CBS 202.75 TaxID=1149848 RepID=UPI0037431AD1